MSLTTPTVTGYSGFWNTLGEQTTYAFMTGQARSSVARRLAINIKRQGTRDAIGALAALIGTAAGGTATNQYKRRQAPVGPSATVPVATGVGDLGGAIAIETVDAINRATTAADVTELKKWFANALLESGITYPTVAGNNMSDGLQLNGVTRF